MLDKIKDIILDLLCIILIAFIVIILTSIGAEIDKFINNRPNLEHLIYIGKKLFYNSCLFLILFAILEFIIKVMSFWIFGLLNRKIAIVIYIFLQIASIISCLYISIDEYKNPSPPLHSFQYGLWGYEDVDN